MFHRKTFQIWRAAFWTHQKILRGRRFQRRFLECGNTEAGGFLCRFHLAVEKYYDEKRFSRGKRPVRFSGKHLFKVVLPQGKAMNVAARLYHRTPQDDAGSVVPVNITFSVYHKSHPFATPHPLKKKETLINFILCVLCFY
ncbi:MAG: hypothetical protein Q4A17_05430 [Thermoguttaceae bacterium]|nr:hypothetical protein [Thermoguttaceae bacterium]